MKPPSHDNEHLAEQDLIHVEAIVTDVHTFEQPLFLHGQNPNVLYSLYSRILYSVFLKFFNPVLYFVETLEKTLVIKKYVTTKNGLPVTVKGFQLL